MPSWTEPLPSPLPLRKLLTLSDDELACCDIAAVNLACAEGLTGAEVIDHAFCLQRLDSWAEEVGRHTERVLPRFYRKPRDYHGSEAYFRVLDMITVLQRDLGVRYDPAKIPEDAPFSPAEGFIHRVIQGPGGTCASLPVVYAAVRRRLGYPIKIVTAPAKKYLHLFARWDDPAGERFNIEASGPGLSCHPDEYYRTGLYHGDARIEKLGCFLRSMTRREELSGFLAERGHCWRQHGCHRQAVNSLAWASAFAPDNVVLRNSLIGALNAWGEELQRLEPPHFPELYFHWPPRRFPDGLRWDLERDILCLEATENLLKDPGHNRNWWEPLQRGQALPWRPVEAQIVYAGTECQIGLRFMPSNRRGIHG